MLRITLLVLILSYTNAFAAIAELNGYDVRKKSDRYELLLGPDNDLLEERDVILFKINKAGRTKILSKAAVLTATQPADDIEAIYKSEQLTLQLGVLRPNADQRTGKRIVVIRLNETQKNRKTLIFETKEKLNSL